MYAARSDSHWLSGPISFTLHASLIVLAVRATTVTSSPTRQILPMMAWPLIVATPCCALPEHPTSGHDGATGVLAAPLTASFDPGEAPTTIPVTTAAHLGATTTPLSGTRPGDDVSIGSMGSSEPVADAPILRRMEEPRYPAEALSRLTGAVDSVVVEYRVDDSGAVPLEGVRVVSTTGEVFSRAVRQALSRARFQPARHDGVAVPALVRQLFRFVRR